MSILINESHAPAELWVRSDSSAVASFSSTFQFNGFQTPVQNVPMVLATATFPSALTKGAVASGWIYTRSLFPSGITGTLYITTASNFSSVGSNALTITIPTANASFNFSSLGCSASGGAIIYLVFVPTSAIPTPIQQIRAFPNLPTTIAYSSMPSNAFSFQIGAQQSTWVKGT
jgi:hypothetical protein